LVVIALFDGCYGKNCVIFIPRDQKQKKIKSPDQQCNDPHSIIFADKKKEKNRKRFISVD
jgi:hypothetical protein